MRALHRNPATLLALLSGSALAVSIPYQGLATDANGNPASDGAHTAIFALYSASSGGTAVWSESREVSTSKGLFSTEIGSATPIPDSLFQGSTLYLGLSFDGGSEAGRSRLASSPWADRSGSSRSAGFSDSSRASRRADSAASSSTSRFADSSRASRRSDTATTALRIPASDSSALAALRDSISRFSARIRDDSSDLASARDSIDSLSARSATQASSLAFYQAILATESEGIPWNTLIPGGYFVDARDGHAYRTTTIGSQIWMAENLDYPGATGDTGRCYENSADSCARYGRLYTWAEATGGTTSSVVPSGVRGLCPSDWHVPSDSEWNLLKTTASATSYQVGMNLKSPGGWLSGTGTDLFGFRAIGGGLVSGTISEGAARYGFWWSSTINDASTALGRMISYTSTTMSGSATYARSNSLSLRCLKD